MIDYMDLKPMVPLYVCLYCSTVVMDKELHTQSHEDAEPGEDAAESNHGWMDWEWGTPPSDSEVTHTTPRGLYMGSYLDYVKKQLAKEGITYGEGGEG